MQLTTEKSLCEEKQKLIVSKDKGTSREHRAKNEDGKYNVRHYKLDGDLVRQQKCCDYLLTNDTLKKAYFIELKGRNIDDAILQLINGAKLFGSELQEYELLYRIVASKVRTHDIQKNEFRKFKDACGSRLKYQTNLMEEKL